MSSKVVVIISTGEREKALTGMMYAYNCYSNMWMDDVKLIFFGPAQKLVLEDEEMGEYLAKYRELDGEAVSCKFITNRDGIGEESEKKGLIVDYVGEKISALLKNGYTPLIW